MRTAKPRMRRMRGLARRLSEQRKLSRVFRPRLVRLKHREHEFARKVLRTSRIFHVLDGSQMAEIAGLADGNPPSRFMRASELEVRIIRFQPTRFISDDHRLGLDRNPEDRAARLDRLSLLSACWFPAHD